MGHAESALAQAAGDAPGRAARASDLCRMVRINEEIKKVMGITDEVNLTALNAKFMAHKSGGKAVGFGVVSTELRQFSKKLEHHMAVLEKLVFGMVSRAAYVGKQARLQGFLEKAGRQCSDARLRRRLEEVIKPKQDELDKIHFVVQRDYIGLRMEVARALKLGRMGSTFAQRAKVEAVYGSELALALTQVSNQVEAAVQRTVDILKNIRTHLGGTA